MWIKTDKESNLKSLREFKRDMIVLGLILLIGFIFVKGCEPKSEIEKIIDEPPTLYDSQTNSRIPSTQQWIISAHELKKQSSAIQGSQSNGQTQSATWFSPSLFIKHNTGQVYFYFDFAGSQKTRKDAEFYLLAICQNVKSHQNCAPFLERDETEMMMASTKNNTDYQAQEYNKSWLYYGHSDQQQLLTPFVPDLQFSIKTIFPQNYHPAWVRLTISENPITDKKVNFFLTNHYLMFFKYLLLLLPIFAFIEFRHYKSFSHQQAVVLGGLLTTLAVIHTLIWDINYMVVGYLLISFSGVMYMFANHLYKLAYGLGYFIILIFAHQFHEGLTKPFFMQIGLITLIGVGIFIKQPD